LGIVPANKEGALPIDGMYTYVYPENYFYSYLDGNQKFLIYLFRKIHRQIRGAGMSHFHLYSLSIVQITNNYWIMGV
jgi:hypothetical protein